MHGRTTYDAFRVPGDSGPVPGKHGAHPLRFPGQKKEFGSERARSVLGAVEQTAASSRSRQPRGHDGAHCHDAGITAVEDSGLRAGRSREQHLSFANIMYWAQACLDPAIDTSAFTREHREHCLLELISMGCSPTQLRLARYAFGIPQ